MRLSADKSDPGYPAFARMLKARLKAVAYVDGKEIEKCVTADTKRGSVVAYARNDKGHVFLNHSRDAAVRCQHFGKVVIEIVPRG